MVTIQYPSLPPDRGNPLEKLLDYLRYLADTLNVALAQLEQTAKEGSYE